VPGGARLAAWDLRRATPGTLRSPLWASRANSKPTRGSPDAALGCSAPAPGDPHDVAARARTSRPARFRHAHAEGLAAGSHLGHAADQPGSVVSGTGRPRRAHTPSSTTGGFGRALTRPPADAPIRALSSWARPKTDSGAPERDRRPTPAPGFLGRPAGPLHHDRRGGHAAGRPRASVRSCPLARIAFKSGGAA
jgi:hypothetical protein